MRIAARYRSHVIPRFRRLFLPFEPDVMSALSHRNADRFLALGILIVGAAWYPVMLLPKSPQQLPYRFLFWAGAACLAAGIRLWINRWCVMRWRHGSMTTVVKSEIDSVLQLSYLLTTAGGLSLMSNADVFFDFWVGCNILFGVVVLDNSVQLTNDQKSVDGVTYANVNLSIYAAVRKLILLQVGSAIAGLTWLVVTRI